MEPLGIYVGKRVAALREQRGLTQAQLAQASGVPQGNISRLERGGAEDLQVSTLMALASALRVKLQTLLPDRPAGPRPARRQKPATEDAA